MKVKICFVIPKTYLYFSPKINSTIPGGAERQAFLLGKMSENDLDIHYCVADFGQAEKETHQNITLWRSFDFKQNSLISLYKLLKILLKIDADLYIFRAASFGTATGILLTKYLLKKKVFYMIANDDEGNSKGLESFIGKIGRILMQKAFKISDIITAQSFFQVEAFRQNYRINVSEIIRNIYTIQIPIADINFEQKDYTVWVGRCHPWKQCEYFLELAKRFPNEKFLMIAPKTEDISYFQKISESAKQIQNLVFLDYIKPDEIKKYYLKAKIYVITSISEGFANTMMEAMESACPILTLNVNPDGILEKFDMGYSVSEQNVNLFYQYFEKLSENIELRTKMGLNARNYLEKYHSETEIKEKFINLIKQKSKCVE